MVWDPKDPWSKKSDPLEDALRQAQSQFQNLLPSFKNLMPSSGFRNVAVAGLLVFVAWQSVFIVAPDEEGVVKRFGAPVRTVGPGPHGKIPFVETVLQPKVQKLHRIEVGFRTDRQGRQQMLAQEALMLTGDMNILAIEFIVQYKIKESANYLFSVAEIHETIGKAAEASMREVVGKGKIDEALTTGKAQIQQDTQVLLQALLDQYQGGIQVAAIQLQDVSPPEAVAPLSPRGDPMRQRQPPRLRGFARDLRKSATNTESELWQSLRARRLGGLKFRRQVPLNGYILDFVCFEAGLVVELDGSQHLGSDADARRDALMRERGLVTLRFENDDVSDDVDAVCAKILEAANARRAADPLNCKN